MRNLMSPFAARIRRRIMLHNQRNRRGPVVPLSKRDPSVPKKVAAVVDKALEPKAKHRYPTAAELAAALEEALAP